MPTLQADRVHVKMDWMRIVREWKGQGDSKLFCLSNREAGEGRASVFGREDWELRLFVLN